MGSPVGENPTMRWARALSGFPALTAAPCLLSLPVWKSSALEDSGSAADRQGWRLCSARGASAAAASLVQGLLLAPLGFSPSRRGESPLFGKSKLRANVLHSVGCVELLVWSGAAWLCPPGIRSPCWWLPALHKGLSKPLATGFVLPYLVGEALQLAAEDVCLAACQQTSGEHQLLQPIWLEDRGDLHHQLTKLQLPGAWLEMAALDGRKMANSNAALRANCHGSSQSNHGRWPVAAGAPAPQQQDMAAESSLDCW